MSFIRRVDSTNSVPSSQGANKPNKSAATAAKVNQIVQFPKVAQEGLQGRAVSQLQQIKNLYKSVQQEWNELSPEDLAEKIIDLEGRVSELTGSSAAIDKIKKQVEHLHFQFVFPIVLELERGKSDEIMPPSFAKVIDGIAKEVLQKNSLQPLNQLNPAQLGEVQKIALRSGS